MLLYANILIESVFCIIHEFNSIKIYLNDHNFFIAEETKMKKCLKLNLLKANNISINFYTEVSQWQILNLTSD